MSLRNRRIDSGSYTVIYENEERGKGGVNTGSGEQERAHSKRRRRWKEGNDLKEREEDSMYYISYAYNSYDYYSPSHCVIS